MPLRSTQIPDQISQFRAGVPVHFNGVPVHFRYCQFSAHVYRYSVTIPTTPIQLRDDGNVKIFIRLNCTDSKFPVSLCITTGKKNVNHEYKSNINIDFNTQHVSDFNDENKISMSCDPLNYFDSHDLDTY